MLAWNIDLACDFVFVAEVFAVTRMLSCLASTIRVRKPGSFKDVARTGFVFVSLSVVCARVRPFTCVLWYDLKF